MGHKLLLADDSITIQKVVGIIFANGEYELSVVDNGVSAVEEARNIVPDVMLIDAIMPGKTGYEVCEEIRKDPSLSHVPVLLLTGVFEPFDEDKARRSGADDFISKPFESQHLLEKVNLLMKMGRERKPAASAVSTPEAPSFASGFDVLGLEEQPAGSPLAPEEPFGIIVEDVAEGDVFDIVSLSADEVVAAAPEDDLWGAVEAFAPDSEEPVLGELVEDEGDIVLEAVTIEEGTSVFDSVEPAEELVFDLEPEPEPEPAKTWVIEDPFAPAEDTASDIFAAAVVPADSIQDAFTVETNTEPEQDFFGTPPEPGIQKVSGPVIEPPSEEYEAFFLEDEGQEVAEAEVAVIEKVEVAPIAKVEEAAAFEKAPSSVSAASEAAAETSQSVSAPSSPAISLSEDQLAAVISQISREIIEKIAWEVVPDLAESMIKEEIRKITSAGK